MTKSKTKNESIKSIEETQTESTLPQANLWQFSNKSSQIKLLNEYEKPYNNENFNFSRFEKCLEVETIFTEHGLDTKSIEKAFIFSGPLQIVAFIVKPNSICRKQHVILCTAEFSNFIPLKDKSTDFYWMRDFDKCCHFIGASDISNINSKEDLIAYIIDIIINYYKYWGTEFLKVAEATAPSKKTTKNKIKDTSTTITEDTDTTHTK